MMLSLLLLPTFATATSTFGGYDVQAANKDLAGVVLDISAIKSTEGGATAAAAKEIYTSGSTVTDPTLQKFAQGSTGTYTGATSTAFASLTFDGATSATMWDDLIMASFDDTLTTTLTDTAKTAAREYGINKGVLGACIFEALNLLEAALAVGPSADAQTHVDKAWAVYYGNQANAKYSAAEVTKKRETATEFGSGTQVFSQLHFAFKQARDALAATGGNADTAADAVKSIKKMIILTFARATIKYSHTRRKASDHYSAGSHMEGDAYYRIFAGVALSFLGNDATAKAELDLISAKMSYQLAESAITAVTDHCEVKKMVEAMYERLELDCAMVGIKPDGMDGSTCNTMASCWENMGGEQYHYMPLSDVHSYALITKDVADITAKTPGDMAGATTVYENGASGAAMTLKAVATTDHGDDVYFKAYKDNFGANSYDKLISDGLAGTGDSAPPKTESFKEYVVDKCGITVVLMATMTLLDDAKTAAAAGKQTYASDGAGFLWDAAYATFHGTSDGKSVGGPASFGTYKGVAAKRDSDFVTADNNAVAVSTMIRKQFQLGKTALMANPYDATGAEAAIAEIMRQIGITFARAAIKYSNNLKKPSSDYSAGSHAEGFCYWRGMAGYYAAETGDTTTVAEIDDLLALSKNAGDIAQPSLHCDVKKKMESLLPGLGVTCTDIGVFKDTSDATKVYQCETTCAANYAAAEAAAVEAAAGTTESTDSRAPLAAVGALVTAFIFA